VGRGKVIEGVPLKMRKKVVALSGVAKTKAAGLNRRVDYQTANCEIDLISGSR